MLKTVGNPSTRYGDQTIVAGNLVIGTAGKGIDFSANPSAAGMTSELLDDYEKGTWTPSDGSGAGLSFTTTIAKYTKVGDTVTLLLNFKFPPTASANNVRIDGLPFSVGANPVCSVAGDNGFYISGVIGGTSLYMRKQDYTAVTDAMVTNSTLFISATYQV